MTGSFSGPDPQSVFRAFYSELRKILSRPWLRHARLFAKKSPIVAIAGALLMAATVAYADPVVSFTQITGSANPLNGVDSGDRSAPAFTDIDNDGDQDFFTGERYGTIIYYENTGTADAPVYAIRTGAANPLNGVDIGDRSTPAFADIDNDGDPDLFIGEIGGAIFYFENTGTAGSPVFTERTGDSNPLDLVDLAGGYGTPAFADIDGDGDLDAFVGEWLGYIYYYENTGTAEEATFIRRTDGPDPLNGDYIGSFIAPAFADIDNDGDLDLFIGDSDGTIFYFENTGTAGSPVFTERTGDSSPLDGIDVGGNNKPAFADIDNDGEPDLFVGETDGVINYFRNDIMVGGNLQFSSSAFSIGEEEGTVTITVIRTDRYEGEVSVDYAISPGTATAGDDYDDTVTTGTLTWEDGDTDDKTFTIDISDDDTIEEDETIGLALSNPQGTSALGSRSSAVLTITDDEKPSVFQFSDATYTIGEDGGTVSITVVRTNGADGVASVDYTISGGTATPDDDYTADASGTLAWVDGETDDKTIEISIVDDSIDELDETIILELSDPAPEGTSSLGTTDTVTLTIGDDEGPSAIGFSAAGYAADEDSETVAIIVTRTNGTYGEMTVDYTISEGTAAADEDYAVTTASGTLTWADGETDDKTIEIGIIDDSLDEYDEDIYLELSNLTGIGGFGSNATASLTIVDNDAPGLLQFAATQYAVDETGETVTITVARSGGAAGAISVDYETYDETATAGEDYTTTAGTLTWEDGETDDKTFIVSVADDALDEEDETIALVLLNPTGGSGLGLNDSATLTLKDDEGPGTVQFADTDYTADENEETVTITVTRTGGSTGAASVAYRAYAGTATSGQDYTGAAGTLTWEDGDNEDKTFTLAITDDGLLEEDETISLALFHAEGGISLGETDTATISLVDDDSADTAAHTENSGSGGGGCFISTIIK